MELGQFKDSDIHQPELKLDETGKAYLLETARWARFLAIIGFVGLAFYALGGIGFAYAITSSPELGMLTKGVGATGILLLYTLFGFVIIYPVVALYRYTVLLKRAIQSNNIVTLNDAFRFHRNYYRYNGIITIVIIGLYALVFVMMIAIGGMAAAA
jgi:hypothetical protein